jgi:hypothetical protein
VSPDLLAELVRALIHMGTLGPVVGLAAWIFVRELRGLREEVAKMHGRLAVVLDRVGVKDTSTVSPKVKP